MESKAFFRRLRFKLSIALFILLISSPIGAQTNYPMNKVTSSYIEASNLLHLTGDDASLQYRLHPPHSPSTELPMTKPMLPPTAI